MSLLNLQHMLKHAREKTYIAMLIPAIIFILIWDFLMFYQIFLPPHMKRSAIISNKDGIYKLLHELPNDLRFRILENEERPGKSQKFIEL